MTVFPQCLRCTHLIPGADAWRCPAFPASEIPQPILTGEHDHRNPFPGDHGIRFEPTPAPDPVPAPVTP